MTIIELPHSFTIYQIFAQTNVNVKKLDLAPRPADALCVLHKSNFNNKMKIKLNGEKQDIRNFMANVLICIDIFLF